MNRSQQAELVAALGDAQAREVGPQHCQEGEGDAQQGAQAGEARLEPDDPNAKVVRVEFERRMCHDLDGITGKPAAGSRSRYAAAGGVGGVARALHELDETMVVDLLAARS